MRSLPTQNSEQLLLSPSKAAQSLMVSRRTIMRAIETHKIKAFRDNRNHWKINESDLKEWASDQSMLTEHAQPEMPMKVELELMKAVTENEQLRERLTSVESDRDRWRLMAEKLSDKPRRWWHRF